MTVGELRAKLAHVPDSYEFKVEAEVPYNYDAGNWTGRVVGLNFRIYHTQREVLLEGDVVDA